MPFSERLYTLFDDSEVAWDAAKALGEIASQDSVLTKANHADIKVYSVL
jgi:DNA repair/transcription protein MET18/MMS19